ncbi:hypothetical protein BB560_000949 [Smittium megazygosporum]|uniref:Uncharacterized protein n=1 Tax=Smittium megazygosporum TaxID=133381 RepID=A0A2T9ZIZ6_9FUNG|nr:hypothetical protein BB560_000949 [Smittium megazygosporum]
MGHQEKRCMSNKSSDSEISTELSEREFVARLNLDDDDSPILNNLLYRSLVAQAERLVLSFDTQTPQTPEAEVVDKNFVTPQRHLNGNLNCINNNHRENDLSDLAFHHSGNLESSSSTVNLSKPLSFITQSSKFSDT